MSYSVLTHQNRDFIVDHYHGRSLKRVAQYAVYYMKSPLYRLAVKLWRPKSVGKHRYNLSIISCFKNEAPYMKEWIEYHLMMGFEHFYLYNNNSDDNFREVLQPYIESGRVTLTEWPQVPAQQAAFEDFYARFRHESQWVSFLDLDEFYCPLREVSVAEWLAKQPAYPVHMIYWQMFGTSGRMQHDTGQLITEQCTVAWPKLDSIGKLIYNTDYDIAEFTRAMIHTFDVKVGPLRVPPMNQFGRLVIYDIHLTGGRERTIQCNHYWSKSYLDYESKHRKGDVAYSESWKTFDKFLLHEQHNTSANHAIYRFLIQLKLRMGISR
jgi:hypothetical protein